MLTRKRVVAETLSDTIAAILEREPDWHALPDATPSSVRHLLRLCLQKDPKRRLHDIADARLELAADDPVERDATRATARTKTRERVAWTLAVLGLSLAVLAWGWRRLQAGEKTGALS